MRRLPLNEMEAAAQVHRVSFDAALPWLAGLHTPDEDRAYFRDRVFLECEVWGVGEDGHLDGFIAWRPGWIDHLYVHPSRQGIGIGATLLAAAQADQPALQLWTFQRNLTARGFYERRGFRPVRETDGARNEETEPDVLYAWAREGAA